MGNMTTHHASSSYTGQRYESSSIFSTPGPNFRIFSNPTTIPFRFSGSPHQDRPQYTTEVGLAILSSLTDETKPFAGVPDSSKSKNIVFGPQLKMKAHLSPTQSHFYVPWGSSPETSFLVPGCTMISPPLGGSKAVYEVGEPSLAHSTNYEGGSHLEGSLGTKPTSHAIQGSLTPSQIRFSEEYTCVISHLPFHKTTHIFCDCVLECHPSNFLDFIEKEKQVNQEHQGSTSYPFDQFLRICFTCNSKLEEGKDIYIYRGDSSFCSEECRFEEIIAEKMERTVHKTIESSPNSTKNGAIFFLGNMPIET